MDEGRRVALGQPDVDEVLDREEGEVLERLDLLAAEEREVPAHAHAAEEAREGRRPPWPSVSR